MKKTLLAIAAVAAMAVPAKAQKAELQISYGGYTQMDATDMHDDWHGVNNAWGAVTAGLNFKVAPKFWIGPSYTFSSTTTKGSHHSNIAYHVIMLNARYEYYRNTIIKLYGNLGVGADISYVQPKRECDYSRGHFGCEVYSLGAIVEMRRTDDILVGIGFVGKGLANGGMR